jgi:flagellar assembly protein FliH
MTTVEAFQYPVLPEDSPQLWDGIGISCSASSSAVGGLPLPQPKVPQAVAESQLSDGIMEGSEDAQTAFEKGRQEGIQEGRQAERDAQRDAQAAADRQRVKQAAALTEKFARERDQYSSRVEHEVVKLALALAARILRREAQMDPLVLTSAVRVALGQLSKSAEVRLRVPPADFDLWLDAMAHIPNIAPRPEVLIGEGMTTGECVVETEIGTVDLGIGAQLDEIERSLFDGSTLTAERSLASVSACEDAHP